MAEVQGWGWQRVHHPEYIEQVLVHFQHSIVTGEPWEDIFPLRSASGQYRWFLSRALPIQDPDGHIVRWFGSNTDITEQREAEEALRKREQELAAAIQVKDDFISIAGHELRTPLTSLKTLFQINQRRMRRGEFIDARHMALQERALVRMERLINDLLDAVRADTRQLEVDCTPTDLVPLCEQVAQDQMLASRRTITLDLAPGPVIVLIDSGRMVQVIGNLLSNALKYSPSNTMVSLCLARDGTDVLVQVIDSGAGIAPSALPHIFDRFYRAPDTQVQHGSSVGLGVGLYLARHLVERQGGTLTVQSTLGVGTTFTVRLPGQNHQDVGVD